jgi:uncharacterized protein (DUF427 family)
MPLAPPTTTTITTTATDLTVRRRVQRCVAVAAPIEIEQSTDHVTVRIDGVLVADSTCPTFVHERGLPRRTYLPRDDVRMELLTPTETSSVCPLKGTASYWTLRTPEGAQHVDIAWSYPTPIPEAQAIAGLLAFYDHRVEVRID